MRRGSIRLSRWYWPSGWISRLFCFVLLALTACGQIGKSAPAAPTVEVFFAAPPVVGDNLLGLRLFQPGRGARPLLAVLEWEAPSGGQHRVEHRLQVPAGLPGRYALPYRLAEAGMHRVTLRLYDAARGVQVHAHEALPLYARPAWVLTADRSYYTGEGAIRFRLQRNLLEQAPHRVAVELRRGAEVISRVDLNVIGREAIGSFAAAALPAGHYELVALVRDPVAGVDVLEVVCDKFPAAEREVKIDQFSQTLLVDGAPFFPVGLYWLHADMLGQARRWHFNSGDYFYKLRGEEVAELMDAAAEEGMQILLELTEFARLKPEPDYRAIAAAVERYRQHPALLAWYLVDEPDETKMDPAAAEAIYGLIRELDPYHPVYLVNNRPHTYAAYAAASDILAVDVYPVPRYPITRVRDYVAQARWTSLGRKPVWLVAQAFGGVEHWPRAPTAAEVRNMTYQGLVQGARGVFFYRYCREEDRHIQPPALWREVQALAAEMSELAPVLVQPDHPVAKGGGAGVEVAVREYQSDYYVFAVNVEAVPRRLDMRLDGLPPVSRVHPLYGAAAAALGAGRLSAALEPLGTAVYRLETAGI